MQLPAKPGSAFERGRAFWLTAALLALCLRLADAAESRLVPADDAREHLARSLAKWKELNTAPVQAR